MTKCEASASVPRSARTLRTVRRALISLLLAAFLTLASCWLLALFGRFTDGKLVTRFDEKHTQIPRDLVPHSWNPRTWHYYRGFGMRRDLVSECMWMGSTLGMSSGLGPQRTIIHIRVGWPMSAMAWYDYSDTVQKDAPPLARAWWMGIDLGRPMPATPPGSKTWRVTPRLPIRPLWPGFAVNSLALAAIFFMLLTGAHAIRRSRRRRQSRCEHCGYQLASLTTCPECGSSSTKRDA